MLIIEIELKLQKKKGRARESEREKERHRNRKSRRRKRSKPLASIASPCDDNVVFTFLRQGKVRQDNKEKIEDVCALSHRTDASLDFLSEQAYHRSSIIDHQSNDPSGRCLPTQSVMTVILMTHLLIAMTENNRCQF